MNEVKLPQLGQSVEEAYIVTWFKQEGDAIEEGEPLFSVQTDKAEIECESTASGTLRKILVEPDIIVPVLCVVALVGDGDEALPDLTQYEISSSAPPAAAPAAGSATPAVAASAQTTAASAGPAPVAPPTGSGIASPRAKRRANELHISPNVVSGSGAGGRVMESDVLAYAGSVAAVSITPTAKRIAQLRSIDIRSIRGTGPNGKITKEDVESAQPAAAAPAPFWSDDDTVVPLTPMRRVIAQRMAESIYTAPHYYVTVSVDMAAAVTFRENTPFKVSYNDIIMRATAMALGEFPQVNARWAEDAIVEMHDINLGVAVALPTGLVVPVVRKVQDMSLQEIREACLDLVEKARTGKLLPDDYSGNTFTLSNLGVFGVDHFTAIINQPDSAIVAVGRIKETPAVVDGKIVARPLMNMTLSSDHRVVDGAVAAQFMGRLREILEAGDF